MSEKEEATNQETTTPVAEVIHKKFEIPSIEEVIMAIKELDDNIEHVSLNLIKCSFSATEVDIRKTFSNYNFLKVKQYNPGSFEVVFPLRIDAIDFAKNAPGKKILGRIFLIKMGRNKKYDSDDWVFVEGSGQDRKRQFNKNRQQGQNRNTRQKEDEEHGTEETKQHREPREHRQPREHKEHREPREFKEHREPREFKEPREHKERREPKQQQHTQDKKVPEEKEEESDTKPIQKRSFEMKIPGDKPKQQRHPQETREQRHPQVSKQTTEVKEAKLTTKTQEPPAEYKAHGFRRGPGDESNVPKVQNLPPKTEQKPETRVPVVQAKDTKAKKEQKDTKEKPKQQPKKESKQQKKPPTDDDGWIIVGKKGR